MTTLLVKPPGPHARRRPRPRPPRAADLHHRLAKGHPARTLDAYTQAHLLDVKERIEKALAAEYPAEAR